MTKFSILFVNFTWILFPIMIFLIYEAYAETMNKKQNELFLYFCLITPLYLIIRFGTYINHKTILEIVMDTIILILYMKKHENKAKILTILITPLILKINMTSAILKYIIYIYIYKKYKSKTNFFIISAFTTRLFSIITNILIINMQNDELIEYIFYYLTTYFIIIFLIEAEKIVQIHISYKELMREHKLKESLFKISHEIKNPIAVCKGYLDMCNSKNIEKYLPILKSEIEKTLTLLQDFSACNKIKIEPDILDITLLIEDIVENLKLIINRKKITLKMKKVNDEIYINGDYNRLNQVLLNILKNSIEAVDKNKKSYIKIYTELTKKTIKIFIEDNGIGISEENLKRISEPFFTTKQNGTGLGVLLSKEIIKAHGGNIEYESEERVGTRVTITLPLLIN
jgi:signal transduction histidine kinase